MAFRLPHLRRSALVGDDAGNLWRGKAMNDMAKPATVPRPLSRAAHDAGMAAYRAAGQRLAAEIGNRGPLRLSDNGALHPDIQAAYWRHG